MMSSFDYVRPGDLQEAVKHLALDGARAHAGGTDLLSSLRDHVFEASVVVSLNNLATLRGISQISQGVRIGALTTLTEVAENPLIMNNYPGLAKAASEVGSPQLRHQGTIGGNLCQKPRCWYYRGEFHCLRKGGDNCFAINGQNQFHCIFGGENCIIVHPSDTAPALTALRAEVIIAGPKGKRRVPLENFFVLPEVDYTRETILEPGEIVTEVFLPAAAPGLKSSYRKIRARRAWDFALAGLALAVRFDDSVVKDARVVFSGAAPTPWRSRETEEAIVGRVLDEQTIDQAAKAAVSRAEPQTQNEYKIPMFMGMVKEELAAIAS